MKKRHSPLLVFFLLTTALLSPHCGWAQENSLRALPEYTNCFPTFLNARTAGNSSSLVTANPQSVSSTNGYAVTPRGTLKVLVIFAGLTNDINVNAPFYDDLGGDNPWPQTDATHPVPGTTFPKSMNSDFYDNPNSFLPGATDHSLSNLFYQMSQHSANPFKMQAVFFPKRINVTATAITNLGSGFGQYTDDVMNAVKNDPDTRSFNFS